MSNFARTICHVSLTSLVVTAMPGLAGAQAPPLWDKLPPGPYVVGFKTSWQLDFSRRYNMTFDDKTTYAPGKAPRPILVNVWYPAKATAASKPMPHRGYLEIQSSDPQLAKFATKLAEYDRAIIAKETLGKPAKELTDREILLLEQFLDTATACTRNAPPAEGRFPLVIYHSGYGSSFEDNSVLCEFLASHGYVVFGSAYQEPGGSSFNIDGKLTSAGDIQFLIGHARQFANVDWNHVGVIGHSGGAHVALMYRAQSGCLADAIVSLDTTEDYYSLADPRWEPMTTVVTNNRANMTGPLLMVANPHAFFQLADALSSARRYYFTIRDLDHDDFISQGGIARALRHRLRFPSAPEAGSPKVVTDKAAEKASLEAVRSAYESLCVYVLRFLDAELKGDAAGKEFLEKEYRDTKLSGTAPHVVFMPVGRTDPDPYPEHGSQPPTPRQLRRVLREHGGEQTIALLRRFRKDASAEPIFHPGFGLALVGELLDRGKTQEAIAFNSFYREFGVDIGKMLLSFGEAFLRQDRRSLARDYFKKVLVLDPSNREAAGKLKELGGLKKDFDGP
jgi:predicted dienelactone hydrolase